MAQPLRDRRMEHPNQPLRLLEAGPGTGALTQALFPYLQPADRLRLVELNQDFVKQLQQRCESEPLWKEKKPRIEICQGSVDDPSLVPPNTFDVIVCGLPFNNFDPVLVERLFHQLLEALKPGGQLTFFEYWGIRPLKTIFVGRDERQRLAEVGRTLQRMVKPLELGYRRVWRNVPPAVVHILRK